MADLSDAHCLLASLPLCSACLADVTMFVAPRMMIVLVIILVLAPSSVGAFVLLPPTPRPSHTSLEASIAPDAASRVNGNDAYQPYRGEQPSDALPEIFVPQVLPEGVDEEMLWVPQTDSVSFRPLCLCVSSGYYVNLLRVRGSGLLSRHRHPGPVHGHVLKGRWRYLEHEVSHCRHQNQISRKIRHLTIPPSEVGSKRG